MIWVRPEDVGRGVVVSFTSEQCRGTIAADSVFAVREEDRKIVVEAPHFGQELHALPILEYALEWASPRDEDLNWRSIAEAVKHFEYWDERERSSREIDEQIRREDSRRERRERWEWLAYRTVQWVGGFILCLLCLAFFLACLIFVFQNPGGKPPWAP